MWGLRLRATGEDVEAARSAGVRVGLVRFVAAVLSGALAGAAGAYISIGVLSSFTLRMTGGRGYMAIAAVIFGKWHPLGAAAAALLFGLFEAASETFAGRLALPQEFFLALPYVLTLAVLAGFVGKAQPPRALGILPEDM
jgi:simple sugar transport system permease protein